MTTTDESQAPAGNDAAPVVEKAATNTAQNALTALYVGNLHWWVTDVQLQTMCEEYGKLLPVVQAYAIDNAGVAMSSETWVALQASEDVTTGKVATQSAWHRAVASDGRPYFYHVDTLEVAWDHES